MRWREIRSCSYDSKRFHSQNRMPAFVVLTRQDCDHLSCSGETPESIITKAHETKDDKEKVQMLPSGGKIRKDTAQNSLL